MAVNPIAIQLIDKFAKNPNPSAYFTKLSRSEIAQGLRDRVNNPNLIQQGNTSLCGATAFVITFARTRIVDYVKTVIQLYDFGYAIIHQPGGGGWRIKPGKHLLNYKPSSETAEVDWIILASIRDSENWLLHYESEDDDASAITRGATLADWLTKAGYLEVVDKTNNYFCKDIGVLYQAWLHYLEGYHVCLLIDANALDDLNALGIPTHWVILASYIDYVPYVSMDVYSWGKKCKLPKEKMESQVFLKYFYGFVAAKY